MITGVTLPLVGRDSELDLALGVVRRAADGHGGAVVVTGEPGAGKSTFLDEVERRADGFRVLRARGVLAEAVLPYAGLQQLTYPVRAAIDELPGPQAHALRAAIGGDVSVDVDRYLVSLGTLGLLSEIAQDAPLLLLVDDVPWLDPASRDALLFACRRIGAERVAAVIGSRADDWADVGDAGLPVVHLSPLGEGDIGALLAERGGAAPQEDVVRRIAAMTAGNPLAIVEFTAELSPDQLRGRIPLPAHLPLTRGLERTFAARLAQLGPEIQAVLLVVSADDTGRLHVVRSALQEMAIAADALPSAMAEGLVVERDERLDLRHPLIRSAAYSRASPDERRAAHRALAAALATEDPDRATWHRAAAADGPDAEIATDLAALATRARRRGALGEAMAAWERASEVETDRARAVDATLAAAAAGWAGGRLGTAVPLLDRLDPSRLTAAQRAEAGWIRGGIELAAGDALRAFRTLVDAADATVDADPERALLMLNVAAEAGSLANDRTATADLGRHAPDIPEGAPVRVRLLHAALLGFAADFAGDVATAVGHLRRSVELAATVDDPTLQLIAGRAAIYCGNDEAARRLHLEVVEDARRRGSVDLVPIAAPRLATAEVLLGRWPSAAATAAESSRIADETGQVLLAPHGRTTLAILAALRDDAASVERFLDEAMASVRDRPMGLIEDDGHWARGLLAHGRDDHAAALVHLERITHPVVQLLASLDRVEVAAVTDDDRLLAWTEPVEPLVASDGPPWAAARLAHARALAAGTPAEAERHFEAALEAAASAGRPFERARIELAAGAHLRRHRQRVDARKHLRSAAATFDLLGASAWAERARTELRATGETAMRTTAPAVDRLTPQELQVARAVGEGYSNKEVAARLFLSPRTVEFHLRNVFAKLEVTSRAQLARLSLEDPATG